MTKEIRESTYTIQFLEHMKKEDMERLLGIFVQAEVIPLGENAYMIKCITDKQLKRIGNIIRTGGLSRYCKIKAFTGLAHETRGD